MILAEEKGDMALEYSPALSGMDGSLEPGEGIYDFTPYDLVMGGYPGYDQVPDAIFTGTWYGQYPDGDGNLLDMTLTLNPDGTAIYSYGEPSSDVLERFMGTWTAETVGDEIGSSRLTLKMTGGPVDEGGNDSQGEQYEISCIFS